MSKETTRIIAGEDLTAGDAIFEDKDGKYYKIRPNIQKKPLTHSTYHTLENRYLTNSRIGDWIKDKCFFKELHITGDRLNKAMTDALRIGQAVDTFIFDGEEAFRKNFIGVTRRNFKNPPINITEITEKQFDDVIAMATVLNRQPAVKDLADYETQKIIKTDMNIGDHFCGLSCIPDWIKIDGDTCHIVDLKTAYDADDRKYFYKCLDYNYFQQFAIMQIIIQTNYPEIKKFTFRHVVIQKDANSIFLPFVYYLSEEMVQQFVERVNLIIETIKNEKDFAPKSVSWKNAIILGEENDNF